VVTAISELPPVWSARRIPIMAPYEFLRQEECRDSPLPHTWQVTSDSIAARLAVRAGAGALLLLKSHSVPAGTTRAEAVARNLVDPFFPMAEQSLPRVACLNLRDPDGFETMLVP